MRSALLAATSALLLGCYELPPVAPARFDPAITAEHAHVVDRVAEMPRDDDLYLRLVRHGLTVVNVAWEDTGRAQGSALGPNISDVTLQVRRADEHGPSDVLMPVIRHPNFSDHTADVPRTRFFVRAGNAQGEGLRTVPLDEVIGDLRRFASVPESLGPGRERIDLRADRDTHYLVSAQAVFLPIPRRGKATFHPVVFNYQSAPDSPAVLTILATREGTSVAVIENRPAERVSTGGQHLYFNEHGHRAAFTAERRSEVAARIAAQGGPRTEAERSALGKGADVMALIQVPLVHANRGRLGGPLEQGYGYEFSEDPLNAGSFGPSDATIRARPASNVERAVLGHGPRLGPFLEGWGTQLVRDARFPVRITVQFYKATSDGVVSDADLRAIHRNLASAYEHADFVGSLVLPENDAARPTAWQKVPGEWFPW